MARLTSPRFRSAALVFSAGALLLLAAATPARRAAPPAEAAQTPTALRIALTGAGLQVTPARITVPAGTTLEWSSDLDFAIAVQRDSTLFGKVLPPAALRGSAQAPVRAAISADAPAGTYKYSVAVWDGEKVWMVDPEIIVEGH